MKYWRIEKYIGMSLRGFANKCGIPSSVMCRFLNGQTDIRKSNKVTGLAYEECFEVIEPFG